MTRCINDHKAWNFKFEIQKIFAFYNLFSEFLKGEESGTNLLGNSTGFTFLDVGFSDLIQESGLTSIDVPQNSANWASELSYLLFEKDTIISQYTAFLFLSEFLLFVLLASQLLFGFLFWFLVFFNILRGILLCIKLHSGSIYFLLLLFVQVKTFTFKSLNYLCFFFTNYFLLLFLFSIFLFFLFSDSFLLLLIHSNFLSLFLK